jgi:hypothetical protein
MEDEFVDAFVETMLLGLKMQLDEECDDPEMWNFMANEFIHDMYGLMSASGRMKVHNALIKAENRALIYTQLGVDIQE